MQPWDRGLVLRELNACLLQRACDPAQTRPVFSGLEESKAGDLLPSKRA